MMQKSKFLLLVLVVLNPFYLQAADHGNYKRNCWIVGTIIFVALAVQLTALLHLPTSDKPAEGSSSGQSVLDRMRAAKCKNLAKEINIPKD